MVQALRADAGPHPDAPRKKRRSGRHLQFRISSREHGRIRYAVSLSGLRDCRAWAVPILIDAAEHLIAEAERETASPKG